MQIAELCRRPVVGIPADASLHEAAALMCEQHVGSLVVVSGQEPVHALGFVTDRDLALDGIGHAGVAKVARVGELVRGQPLAVPASAGVREAAAAMEAAGVRRLLVVDDDGGVVGVVSADDLLEALAEDLASLARAFRKGIARETAERSVYTGPARARVVYPAFGSLAAQ